MGLRSPITPGTVEQWLGISLDEVERMSRSQDQWINFRYPLIDKHLTRRACRQWFQERYPCRPLVKSACGGCARGEDWRVDPERYPDCYLRMEAGSISRFVKFTDPFDALTYFDARLRDLTSPRVTFSAS